jgi:hypothetical protein
VGAARLILDRVVPIPRGRPVRLKLPDIVDGASVMVAQASLLNEVARGNLTPEEAESLSAMLSTYLKTVETVYIDRRLRDLESKTMVPE